MFPVQTTSTVSEDEGMALPTYGAMTCSAAWFLSSANAKLVRLNAFA